MKLNIHFFYAAGILFIIAIKINAQPIPFDGQNFKGRIAFNHDGNINDPDDWASLPAIFAVLDAFGVLDKLVHVDYNNILSTNDTYFAGQMHESAMGAAERYNVSKSILFDCQKDVEGAIESIKNAINASSEDDPLYFGLGGTTEVFFLGIERSNPEKRKYVYCISMSAWNEGFTRSVLEEFYHKTNKRDLIPTGIQWISIPSGNIRLAHPGGGAQKSTPEQWQLYEWLRDADDPNLNWLFSRLEETGKGDFCETTLAYFLVTGDEEATLDKLKNLLVNKKIPPTILSRYNIKIEAEDFITLENYSMEYRLDRGTSREGCGLSIRLASLDTGRIRTTFNQLYSLAHGLYDIDVRYFDHNYGQSKMTLYINGDQQGESWFASADDNSWKTHTVTDVAVSYKDEILVEVIGNKGEYGNLDYVQLNSKGKLEK